MKVIFVILNGFPLSGKDEFADFCNGFHQGQKYSTVDTVKELAIKMGWNGIKTEESRIMLSELKDFVTKHFNMTYHEICDLIQTQRHAIPKDQYYFIYAMIREPEEIMKMEEYCKDNGIQCCPTLVDRGNDSEKNHKSHSDSMIEDFDYKYVVPNFGTKDDLKMQAGIFINYLQAEEE